MIILYKIESDTPVGEPITLADLRALYPETAMPIMPDRGWLAEQGWALYQPHDKPAHGPLEVAEEVGLSLGHDGVVRTVWSVRHMTESEAENATADRASDVRRQRGFLLAETDWTQLADAPVNSLAWANYRQALRDITAQPGFPWSVDWPTPPSLS